MAAACRELDIRAVAVTAGYVLPAPRQEFYRWMDAANVDSAALAVVGALGDAQDAGERRSLTGLNARIVGMFVGPNTLTEHYFRQFCVSRKEWDDMLQAARDGKIDHYHARNSVSVGERLQQAKQTPEYQRANHT